jgi:nicotinate phosphoribosyltransferase
MKLSRDKATYPYRKQVWRKATKDGAFEEDVIAIADETDQQGSPLLTPVMRDGEISGPLPALEEIREYAKENLRRLPERFKKFTGAEEYPVRYSIELERRRLELLEEYGATDA